MTFLKKKFAEAEELLLKVREKQFVFFVAPHSDDAREFIEYFYSGLLQTKKWHISDNNKWKVIEFDLKDDVYIETIEKILEKNNFTDMRVSLDFESTMIQNLRQQKTSLNKLYRSFQYAFKFNYLFCIFLEELNEDIFYEKIRDISLIFETAVRRKVEPLYCILSLSDAQFQLLQKKPELVSIAYFDDSVFQLPVLNFEDIGASLNEYPLFRNSKEDVKNDLIEDIAHSGNILLQLKNAIRKISVGIMPVREVVHKPLQIKKEAALKINLKDKDEDPILEKNNESTIIQKSIIALKLDKLFEGIGTRFQRDNFKKILLYAFHISEDKSLYHNDLNGTELTAALRISEKDILNAIHPFIQNKYISYDPDAQSEIRYLNPDAFYQWPFLVELITQNQILTLLFDKITELILMSSLENTSANLASEEWSLIDSGDLDFYLGFNINNYPGLTENIKLLLELKPPIVENSEEEKMQIPKIKFGADNKKISFNLENVDKKNLIDSLKNEDIPSEINQPSDSLLNDENINHPEDNLYDDSSSVDVILKDELLISEQLDVIEHEEITDVDLVELEDISEEIDIHNLEVNSETDAIAFNFATRDEPILVESTDEISSLGENDTYLEDSDQMSSLENIREISKPVEAQNGDKETSSVDPAPAGSFKIKPMAIRPQDETNNEPPPRTKLTFKKKE